MVVVVVAMMVAEAGGVERAVLETVLYSPVQNGGYVTQSEKLSGIFSPSGTAAVSYTHLTLPTTASV